jgi:hypothetical protein
MITLSANRSVSERPLSGGDLALALAAAGFAIIPVNLRQVSGGWRKEPLVRNWRNRPTTDRRIIEGWWRQFPSAVPGIVLEACGLVVVDADRHPGKPDGVARLREFALPPHPIATTVSGGEHHYFRQPTPAINFFRWDGGEVLGTTRFVVGYRMVRGQIPQFPDWLRGALRHSPQHSPPHHSHHFPLRFIQSDQDYDPDHRPVPTLHLQLRSNFLLDKVARAQAGNRNNCLHWAACRFGNIIGEGKIKPEVAQRLLIEAAKTSGLWQDDGAEACGATIISGLREGMVEWGLAGTSAEKGARGRGDDQQTAKKMT